MRPLDVFPLEPWVIVTSTYRSAHRPGHRGVDYGHPIPGPYVIDRTPIRSPFDGALTIGVEAGGAGNWVNVLRDDGLLWKCFHLSKFNAGPGRVNAGEVVGYVGTTGSSTAPHAHMELWANGRDFDPLPMFTAAQQAATIPPAPEDWLTMATEQEVEAIVRRVVQEEIANQDKRMQAAIVGPLFAVWDQLDPRRSPGVPVTPVRDLVEQIHNDTKPVEGV